MSVTAYRKVDPVLIQFIEIRMFMLNKQDAVIRISFFKKVA